MNAWRIGNTPVTVATKRWDVPTWRIASTRLQFMTQFSAHYTHLASGCINVRH